ncbi:hypothetical protein CI109_102223 [Kwoniella shandongensis]|uniref:Uncharacterized protein n=1 Tax=Kwoniella shandongensis TaxID=1734106 RepID=A0A5M6C467_9TREE|nr:uncharacterized protein CI109_003623 [Kwoniella shandongensis]KAA5527969.1 hypothetical protein CI109_003623 [Kwoniella shandongensis]
MPIAISTHSEPLAKEMALTLKPSQPKAQAETPRREPSFYQAAYTASMSYLLTIRADLITKYGFREIGMIDEVMSRPFIHHAALVDSDETHHHHSEPNAQPMIINLIYTPPDSNVTNRETTIHLIQLPYDISSLVRSTHRDDTIGHGSISIESFATLLTPSSCHVTNTTMSIPPLSDLINFLQCLLPSSSALALSPYPTAIPPRKSFTTLDEDDNRREGGEETIVAEGKNSKVKTPRVKWLDRNEDLLRDTVGCSYYRHLRDVAGKEEMGTIVEEREVVM